jgi:MYXO-CTERM domain-containing protein
VNRNTNFTPNEQVAMVTLWALLPSPLMLGANLTLTTDPFFGALVTNEEVIAVGQDDLGAKARFVVRNGTTEVWSKDLSGGRKAVGLFNRGAADATVAITWAALGLSGPLSVRNLWTRTDLGSMASGASILVPWHAAALLLVAPAAPPPPDGGAGIDAAGDGAADVAVDSGMRADAAVGAGVGGANGAGGRADTAGAGGSATGTGGASVAGSGGSSGSGTGGASGATGCSCDVGAGEAGHGKTIAFGSILIALLALARTRRRKARV